MKQVFLCVVFLFALAPFTAQAEAYEPGSVGYLYADCEKALANSENPEALYDTYCGAFLEGYFSGIMATGGMKFPPPADKDPCAVEKQAAYERINGRFCPNLPAFEKDRIDAAYVLRGAANMGTRWVSWLSGHDKKVMNQQASEAMGAMIRPGAFCDSLVQAGPPSAPAPEINPALLKTGWKDFLGIRDKVALAHKYEQCVADLETAGDSAEEFAATRCGAEISGFLAALNSTAYLQEDRPADSGSCARQMDRLYNSLDVTKTMCLQPGTAPGFVARLFTQKIGALSGKERKRYKGFTGLGALGAVGYETIYSGTMCLGRRP